MAQRQRPDRDPNTFCWGRPGRQTLRPRDATANPAPRMRPCTGSKMGLVYASVCPTAIPIHPRFAWSPRWGRLHAVRELARAGNQRQHTSQARAAAAPRSPFPPNGRCEPAPRCPAPKTHSARSSQLAISEAEWWSSQSGHGRRRPVVGRVVGTLSAGGCVVLQQHSSLRPDCCIRPASSTARPAGQHTPVTPGRAARPPVLLMSDRHIRQPAARLAAATRGRPTTAGCHRRRAPQTTPRPADPAPHAPPPPSAPRARHAGENFCRSGSDGFCGCCRAQRSAAGILASGFATGGVHIAGHAAAPTPPPPPAFTACHWL